MKGSIFIRYRHGTLLFIEPDIKSKIVVLTKALKASLNHEQAFRELIKDIADGSGSGISPDSTWFQAARELYEGYKRYYSSTNVAEGTKIALLGLFELLAQGGDERMSWDKIRTYLIDNLDQLSPMPDRYLATFEGHEVKRDAGGIYYYEDDKLGTVIIQGLKTPAEETLRFYTEDTQMPFGRLYRILKFIALFDIAYEYTHSPGDFPSKLSCTLYDNDGWPSYLSWQWQMPSPFEYVPMQWYPRSPFSNPQWLGSDLVMNLTFPNSEPGKPILPTPPTNESLQRFNDAFRGYKWQLEIPMISSILLGEEPEVYFDFLGRKVRWVNGNAFIEPMLTIPCNDEDGADGLEIARKFLSLLNIEHEVALSEQLISIQQPRYIPWFKQPRMTVFNLVSPDYALPQDDYTKYKDKKWYALAFMREAVSSQSIHYSYLNYFKVIELANKGDGDKTKKWINANIERVCKTKNIDWYEENVAKGGEADPGLYLWKTGRVAIAHAEYTYQVKGTHNPDNPRDWQRTRKDLTVVRELAKDIIRTL